LMLLKPSVAVTEVPLFFIIPFKWNFMMVCIYSLNLKHALSNEILKLYLPFMDSVCVCVRVTIVKSKFFGTVILSFNLSSKCLMHWQKCDSWQVC
jgi:hypothetical protein